MDTFFRSEKMALFHLLLHSEVAYECISELGERSLVQFCDLNSKINVHQRDFVSEVRRCADVEHKLRYLEKEIDKAGVAKLPAAERLEAPRPTELVNLEMRITNTDNELREVNKTIDILKRNELELKELKHVLHETEPFFVEEGETCSTESVTKGLLNDHSTAKHTDAQLDVVTGVINRERFPGFERMLWRVYRGNVLFRHADIKNPLEDPSTGHLMYKSVFLIILQEQLKALAKKICAGFGATLYICPNTAVKRREVALSVSTRIQDLELVLNKSRDLRTTLMLVIAKYVKTWSVKITKMKAIYHTFNSLRLDVNKNCLVAECWVPVSDIEHVKMALKQGMKRSDSYVSPIMKEKETTEEPPTYIRTNKFTRGFQYLIEAYGVATYREINPTPFTIITFPFLFAVMFGDLGHGVIIFLFAGWMVVKEKYLASKNIESDIWNILFGGRYVILLMGMFSMYTGFIYNDVFSKSMNILGSHWNVSLAVDDMMKDKYVTLDPKDCYVNTPYPIGLDSIWQMAENKIRFLNAYKMKISIIIGVFHMLFGVSLTVFNYIHFNNKANLIVLFLPEVLFLLCLFFYLVLLIFIKWVMYGPDNPVETGPGCAPSILVTFINMVLFSPGVATESCSPWMYAGQMYVQNLLVVVAVICIPWLLVAKPYLTLRENSKQEKMLKEDENNTATGVSHSGNHTDKTELWIHQGIHTIEYVLGSVSHTASYLRLWALSLAHAQLSEVLWKMVMNPGLTCHSQLGAVAIFFAFPCWAVLTIGVLVVMEGLSAFLHTLRLHWVEFQSKFYDGTGHPFIPFSFDTIFDQSSLAGSEK